MPGEVTIDFGIDLGTTNSSIAVFENGSSTIIKCHPNETDVIPSVVSRSGNQEFVGDAAKARIGTNPDSTFAEFKRDMGTTTTYPLAEGGRVSPEELSASVLRTLRSDAIEFTRADVTAVVITVPAAFDTAQMASTRKAAELAGFSHVETLQEPIAAALAYGFDQSGDGVYLVFDLGGGTFDAALLRSAGGVFSVLNHRGDNDLGGGRWDTAIVEEILMPKLLALGCKVAGARDRKSSVFSALKPQAESARKELSRKESTLFQFSVEKDEEGRRLPDDVPMERSELEALIDGDISRCVGFCRDLLTDANLPPSAVSKVIFVGGPTRTPAVRAAVEALGIDVATMVDPMTVVARGAAVYAASRTRPVVVPTAMESAVFQLVYDAMVEHEKEQVVVGLRLERAPESSEVGTVRIVATDGSWDSGAIAVEDGGAIVTVKLGSSAVSTFRISALTVAQAPVKVIPDAFSVTRGVAASAAPVNHSIRVGVDNDLGGGDADEIVKRGTTMPVFSKKVYRTTRMVTPREPDADPVRLRFLEGESNVPDRNLKVGEIAIESHKITRPLPANSEVEVTIRWEQGQDPKASAYIPFLDQQFDEVLTIQNKSLPDVNALEGQVAAIRHRLGSSASGERAAQIREVETRLSDARKGDPAAAHSAAAGIGPLLDAIEAESGHELIEAAETELHEAIEWSREIAVKYGTEEDRQELEGKIREAQAAKGGGHRDIDYKRERIMSHTFAIIVAQPGFWIQKFTDLSERAGESADPVRAGALIQRGNSALNRQDIDELQSVVREFWDLFPDSSDPIQSFGIRKQ